MDKVLKYGDDNGDGHINFKEFLKIIAKFIKDYETHKNEEEIERIASKFTEEEKKAFKEKFNKYDLDKSGTISVYEIGDLIRDDEVSYCEWNPTEEEIEEVMKHADEKHDNYIDFHDFLKMVARFWK